MTATNRVRLAAVRESTIGTTPNSPRMRTMRVTGESLTFSPSFVDSEEIRSDRMIPDPIEVMQMAGGGLNFELFYPADLGPVSEMLRSAFYNSWVNAPSFDNDGTADSVITDAGTSANTYVVTSGGASVKLGHLVRATGFTNAANNQTFRAASSTGTTIVGAALSLTAEAVPPGTARLKVIGFQGASGDITAAAAGLGSTALDFTTLGLAVGQWLKIDSTTSGMGFATAANNDWVRISGTITATSIPLDNLPSGWSVDAGTSKTIKVYFGDVLKNGTTQNSLSIEKGFLGQTTPTYIVYRGMTADTLQVTIQNGQRVTCTCGFMGMGGAQSTTPQSGSPDAVSTARIIAANANVGRLGENGSSLTSPNWSPQLDFQIKNNLREIQDISQLSPVAVREGGCDVTFNLDTYFGDNTLLAKLYANTLSSLTSRVQKDSQALIFQFPRITYKAGDPQAGARNQDVRLKLAGSCSYDSTTGAHVLLDRIEFYA